MKTWIKFYIYMQIGILENFLHLSFPKIKDELRWAYMTFLKLTRQNDVFGGTLIYTEEALYC